MQVCYEVIYTTNVATTLDIIKIIKPYTTIPIHYKENDAKVDVDTIKSFISMLYNFKRWSMQYLPGFCTEQHLILKRNWYAYTYERNEYGYYNHVI